MLERVQLGSGLTVSRLCLGTMNFGQPGQGSQGDWALDPDQARAIFRSAIDNGLFYFDCADVYGRGTCETVVGRLLRELLHTATSTCCRPRSPCRWGRARIRAACRASTSSRGSTPASGGWGTTTSTCW